MCGRYTLTNPSQIEMRFDTFISGEDLQPDYNIAPTQAVPVIIERSEGRVLRRMRWGFQPTWATANAGRPAPINARAETLLERPLFRGAVARARCLIPADGFYEWERVAGRQTKQPMHIRREDRGVFAFAGLYTEGRDGQGVPTASCAIITTTPNALMIPIHDRMPAILDPAAEARWLDPALTDPLAVLECLQPCPADLLVAYPVSPRVSSPRADGPSLIEPLTA